MIALFLSLFGSGIVSRLLNFGFELVLKLVSFVLYLASEYWGRWVLAAVIVFCALCYGRWHYIEQGRSREASFRELVVEAELEQRCVAKNGVLNPKGSDLDSWLPKGWPRL